VNKKGKDLYSILEKNTPSKMFIGICRYEFLLCSKLSEDHDRLALLVGFIMLLYD
jgi:hypothetical protein